MDQRDWSATGPLPSLRRVIASEDACAPVANAPGTDSTTELNSLQLAHVSFDSFTQRLQVVTTFHARDDAATAGFACPFLDDPSHLDKVIVSQKQLAQRIIAMRVKPGRDNHK